MKSKTSTSKLIKLLNNPKNIEIIRINQEYSKKAEDYRNEKEREFQEEIDREIYPYYY